MTRRENTAEQTRGSFSRNNLVTGPMEGEGTEEGGVFVYIVFALMRVLLLEATVDPPLVTRAQSSAWNKTRRVAPGRLVLADVG